MKKLKPNQDLFVLIINECLEHTKYKSEKSIYLGLKSLLQSDIIARGPVDLSYYINPMVLFNGNRITFANTYLKMSNNQKQQFEYQENKLFIESNQKKLIESLQEENKKLQAQLIGQRTKKQLTLEETISNENL